MYKLLLCRTRDYHPKKIEHYLSTKQNKIEWRHFAIKKDPSTGSIKIITSDDWSEFLEGSKCEKIPNENILVKNAPYHLVQKNSFIFPIKRYSQFEYLNGKERIYPIDQLINNLYNSKNGFVNISYRSLSNKKRINFLEKCKRAWFDPNRKFDVWESKHWNSLRFIRFLGPTIRKLRPPPLKLGILQDEKTASIHEKEDKKSAVLDKLARPLFEVRISMSHNFKSYFQGFSMPYLGTLCIGAKPAKLIFSAEELATLLSLPDTKHCMSILEHESSAFLPSPDKNPLCQSSQDRQRHLYIVGKTGTGKSTMLLNLIEQDMQKNQSLVLMDPHGDLIKEALSRMPQENIENLIVIDPSEMEYPLALNPIECRPEDDPNLKCSQILEMFKALSNGSWGPRLEYILRNALITLILIKNTTLLDLPRLLTNREFCMNKIQNLKDFEVLRFWHDEFLMQDERTRQEHCASILNKVGPFLTTPLLRNIFGQPRSKFNFDMILEQQKSIFIHLPKGKLGVDGSRMLGMTFIALLQSALLKQSSLAPENRRHINVFIDEFQNFATETLISMLSESRKYGLALTFANQFLDQVEDEIKEAIIGNVGSMAVFRTGFNDAKLLAPQLGLTEEDLTELSPFQAYCKFLKNGKAAPLFRVNIEKPLPPKSHIHNETILKNKITFTRRRSLVEEKLMKRYTDSKSNTPT